MAFVGGDPDDLDAVGIRLYNEASDMDGAAFGVNEQCLSAQSASGVVAAAAIEAFRIKYAPGLGAIGANVRILGDIAVVQGWQLRAASGLTSAPPPRLSAAEPTFFPLTGASMGAVAGAVVGVQGDPEILSHVGGALCHLAEQVRTGNEVTHNAVSMALKAWDSVRADMFMSAALLPSLAGEVAARELHSAGVAIRDYANVVEEARGVLAPRCVPNVPDPYSDLKKNDAIERVKEAEERLAVALYTAVGMLTVPQVSPTPAELLAYINKVGNVTGEAKETYGTVNAVVALAAAPSQFKAGMKAHQAWKSLRTAVGKVGESTRGGDAVVAATEKIFGKSGSQSMQAWARASGDLTNTRKELLDKAGSAVAARRSFLETVAPVGRFGRVVPAVGAMIDLYGIKNPKHNGARGVGDRAASTASFTANMLTIGVGITLASGGTAAPAVAAAIVVLGVSAATWEIGSLAYDNRAEIRRTLTHTAPYREAAALAKDCSGRVIDCGRAAQRRTSPYKEAVEWVTGWRP